MANKGNKGTEDTAPNAGAPTGGIDDIDESAMAFDGGEKVSGGFTGPSWMPHLVEFSDTVIKQKLANVGAGSSIRATIAGFLREMNAWGKRLYFVDIPVKGGAFTRVHVPEHEALYGSLGAIKVGARVQLTYVGRGKAKPNQSAPHVYEVVAEKGSVGARRADALNVVKKQEAEEELPELPPQLQ